MPLVIPHYVCSSQRPIKTLNVKIIRKWIKFHITISLQIVTEKGILASTGNHCTCKLKYNIVLERLNIFEAVFQLKNIPILHTNTIQFKRRTKRLDKLLFTKFKRRLRRLPIRHQIGFELFLWFPLTACQHSSCGKRLFCKMNDIRKLKYSFL